MHFASGLAFHSDRRGDLIRGEGLCLDMTHAAGHRVIDRQPPLEEELLTKRRNRGLLCLDRQRRKAKRSCAFLLRANLGQEGLDGRE